MHYVHRGEPASRVKLTKRALDKKSERMEERGVRISETVYVHACTGVCVYTREREREREREGDDRSSVDGRIRSGGID